MSRYNQPRRQQVCHDRVNYLVSNADRTYSYLGINGDSLTEFRYLNQKSKEVPLNYNLYEENGWSYRTAKANLKPKEVSKFNRFVVFNSIPHHYSWYKGPKYNIFNIDLNGTYSSNAVKSLECIDKCGDTSAKYLLVMPTIFCARDGLKHTEHYSYREKIWCRFIELTKLLNHQTPNKKWKSFTPVKIFRWRTDTTNSMMSICFKVTKETGNNFGYINSSYAGTMIDSPYDWKNFLRSEDPLAKLWVTANDYGPI